MNKSMIFIVRVLLDAFFAVLLTWFFFPGSDWTTMAGIGIVLVLLAYVFDYLRSRRQADE